MKEQTAIEWLLEQIETKNGKDFSAYYSEFVDKAKEMEKEQLIMFGYAQIQEIDSELGGLIYRKVPEEVYHEKYGAAITENQIPTK
jgi:hypothetical protein